MVTPDILKVIESMRHDLIPNYISPGLNSWLISQVRLFENTRKQGFFITPHSHRFDFACYVLRGSVRNTIYTPGSGDKYLVSEYFVQDRSTKPRNEGLYAALTTQYNADSWYYMQYQWLHSIEFSTDALILFMEGAKKTEVSYILEPIVSGRALKTFSVDDWMYHE